MLFQAIFRIDISGTWLLSSRRAMVQYFSSRTRDTDGRFHSMGRQGRLHLRHATLGKSSRYGLPLLVRTLGKIKQW